jgi:hypothetical protein
MTTIPLTITAHGGQITVTGAGTLAALSAALAAQIAAPPMSNREILDWATRKAIIEPAPVVERDASDAMFDRESIAGTATAYGWAGPHSSTSLVDFIAAQLEAGVEAAHELARLQEQIAGLETQAAAMSDEATALGESYTRATERVTALEAEILRLREGVVLERAYTLPSTAGGTIEAGDLTLRASEPGPVKAACEPFDLDDGRRFYLAVATGDEVRNVAAGAIAAATIEAEDGARLGAVYLLGNEDVWTARVEVPPMRHHTAPHMAAAASWVAETATMEQDDDLPAPGDRVMAHGKLATVLGVDPRKAGSPPRAAIKVRYDDGREATTHPPHVERIPATMPENPALYIFDAQDVNVEATDDRQVEAVVSTADGEIGFVSRDAQGWRGQIGSMQSAPMDFDGAVKWVYTTSRTQAAGGALAGKPGDNAPGAKASTRLADAAEAPKATKPRGADKPLAGVDMIEFKAPNGKLLRLVALEPREGDVEAFRLINPKKLALARIAQRTGEGATWEIEIFEGQYAGDLTPTLASREACLAIAFRALGFDGPGDGPKPGKGETLAKAPRMAGKGTPDREELGHRLATATLKDGDAEALFGAPVIGLEEARRVSGVLGVPDDVLDTAVDDVRRNRYAGEGEDATIAARDWGHAVARHVNGKRSRTIRERIAAAPADVRARFDAHGYQAGDGLALLGEARMSYGDLQGAFGRGGLDVPTLVWNVVSGDFRTDRDGWNSMIDVEAITKAIVEWRQADTPEAARARWAAGTPRTGDGEHLLGFDTAPIPQAREALARLGVPDARAIQAIQGWHSDYNGAGGESTYADSEHLLRSLASMARKDAALAADPTKSIRFIAAKVRNALDTYVFSIFVDGRQHDAAERGTRAFVLALVDEARARFPQIVAAADGDVDTKVCHWLHDADVLTEDALRHDPTLAETSLDAMDVPALEAHIASLRDQLMATDADDEPDAFARINDQLEEAEDALADRQEASGKPAGIAITHQGAVTEASSDLVATPPAPTKADGPPPSERIEATPSAVLVYRAHRAAGETLVLDLVREDDKQRVGKVRVMESGDTFAIFLGRAGMQEVQPVADAEAAIARILKETGFTREGDAPATAETPHSCSACGADHRAMFKRCPDCDAWDTVQPVTPPPTQAPAANGAVGGPLTEEVRVRLYKEFERRGGTYPAYKQLLKDKLGITESWRMTQAQADELRDVHIPAYFAEAAATPAGV